MGVYSCAYVYACTHACVHAGVCLFGHMYIGNVLLCAHICMPWSEYSWKVSSLTWGEVWAIHGIVPVPKGPVIPEPKLCVGWTVFKTGFLEKGLSLLWGRGCHSCEDSATAGQSAKQVDCGKEYVCLAVILTSCSWLWTGLPRSWREKEQYLESLLGQGAGWLKKMENWAGEK